MASTYTRKLIYCLQEAHFTLSLVMTVAHEYYVTFSTKQHVLARECQLVETSQFLKVMSSRDESCLPLGRKQRSIRRRKVRPRSSKLFGKATSEESSSPVVAPTATVKKLALPKPHSSSMDLAVSTLVTDGACTDSICEMNGLRLIDLGDLLASVTRRENCNVCGSGLTVRESLKNRRGLCTKLTLSCTNPLCTEVEDAFSDPCKHSKALNSRFILAGRMCGKGSAGQETICGVMGPPPPVFPKCFTEHNWLFTKLRKKFVKRALDLLLHSCVDCRVLIQMMLLMSQSHVMVPGPVVGLWRIMVWWQCCHGRRARYLIWWS